MDYEDGELQNTFWLRLFWKFSRWGLFRPNCRVVGGFLLICYFPLPDLIHPGDLALWGLVTVSYPYCFLPQRTFTDQTRSSNNHPVAFFSGKMLYFQKLCLQNFYKLLAWSSFSWRKKLIHHCGARWMSSGIIHYISLSNYHPFGEITYLTVLRCRNRFSSVYQFIRNIIYLSTHTPLNPSFWCMAEVHGPSF